MDQVTMVGMMAGVCTTICFLPQVFKIYQTKHTADLSYAMWMIFSFGVFLWLCYGVMVKSLPVILANAITLVLSVSILVMKIRYK